MVGLVLLVIRLLVLRNMPSINNRRHRLPLASEITAAPCLIVPGTGTVMIYHHTTRGDNNPLEFYAGVEKEE